MTLLVIFRLSTFEGTFEVYEPEELEKLEMSSSGIRSYLSEQAAGMLPQPQAALLAGMVIGVKEDLPAEFKKALRNTSTIHIVVVSGQNLTLFSAFILGFASIIGRRKALLLSLGLSFLYAVITGLQVPVLRAFIMFGVVAVSQLLNREIQSIKVLVMTGLLMLIYNPSWAFSISFQLSFLATVGVIAVAPQLQRNIKFLPEIISADLCASLAAQLLTLPVIAINFHQMSLAGVLVNALVLWTVPLIMIFGVLALILNLIIPILGQVLILIPYILLTFFVYIVEFFNQPWASVYVPKLNPSVWLGYFLLLAGIYYALVLRSKSQDEADVISLDNVQSKD